MKLFKNIQFFICLLFLHVELLAVFFFNFYTLYFLNLFIAMYMLKSKYSDFSLKIFFLFASMVLLLINLEIYEDVIFELYLWLNILDEVPYINDEVMYALTFVHILLFINLKKFENIWAIIDEKLFRD